GDGRITVANFGDGASNIGAFHESLNLASVWKLPVVFVCQNNRYAEHSKYERYTAGADIAGRAKAYGMPGIAVDGNDASAMWMAAGEAVDRARAGGGPTLIEAKTFRFCGHLLGDDSSYIPADEMAEAKAQDPLPKLRAQLLADGHATADELSHMEAEIKQEVTDARDFALASPWPETAELARDVLGNNVSQNIT